MLKCIIKLFLLRVASELDQTHWILCIHAWISNCPNCHCYEFILLKIFSIGLFGSEEMQDSVANIEAVLGV